MNDEKAKILQRIAHLKATKPDGWKGSIRNHLYRLAYLDDPYATHEDRGTEQRGRKIHRTDQAPY